MPARRRRLAALVAAGLLAAPASALGQSAGDDQYEDPFAGEDQQQLQDDGGGQAPAPAPAPESAAPAPEGTAPAPTTATPGTAEPAAQAELPRTGADTGTILLAGSVLIAGGIALRVRVRE